MSTATVTPALTLLTTDQIHQIHHHALTILGHTGIRVDCPDALKKFKQRGCRIENDRQVLFDKALVEWALKEAPSSVDVYNRTGEKRFTLGKEASSKKSDVSCSTRFGIGVTNLHYQDPLTDSITPFTLDHVAKATRLGNALDAFDVISTPGIAQDLTPDTADLHMALAMTANTVKPIVLLVSEPNCFEPVLTMLETLDRESSASKREKAPSKTEAAPDRHFLDRPWVIPYFNPITPLVLNRETAEKIMTTIDRGLPFIYSNYGMSGATAPITPGATLALLTAELLAGIVFSQILKPGTPIIAGSLPAGFDMKTMMSVYTPHTMLINIGCSEMMGHYGIPHSGTSGSGPGWGPDLLAGGGFWMNHFSSILGKVGLCPFVGGNFDSMVFSPAAVVYAGEVIRLSRMFAAGFSIEAADVSTDEIKAIGSAGNFLSAPSTGKRFKEFRFESSIWPGYTLEQWQEKGAPKSGKVLREYTHEMIDNAVPPDDHDALMERGRAFISAL